MKSFVIVYSCCDNNFGTKKYVFSIKNINKIRLMISFIGGVSSMNEKNKKIAYSDVQLIP